MTCGTVLFAPLFIKVRLLSHQKTHQTGTIQTCISFSCNESFPSQVGILKFPLRWDWVSSLKMVRQKMKMTTANDHQIRTLWSTEPCTYEDLSPFPLSRIQRGPRKYSIAESDNALIFSFFC